MEQYHMVWPKHNASVLTQPGKEVLSEASQNLMEDNQEEGQTTQQNTHYCPCLGSGSTILFM